MENEKTKAKNKFEKQPKFKNHSLNYGNEICFVVCDLNEKNSLKKERK